MFICRMVLQCATNLKTWLESGPVTTDFTTTVIRSYKLLINAVKPVHSLYNSNLFIVTSLVR